MIRTIIYTRIQTQNNNEKKLTKIDSVRKKKDAHVLASLGSPSEDAFDERSYLQWGGLVCE